MELDKNILSFEPDNFVLSRPRQYMRKYMIFQSTWKPIKRLGYHTLLSFLNAICSASIINHLIKLRRDKSPICNSSGQLQHVIMTHKLWLAPVSWEFSTSSSPKGMKDQHLNSPCISMGSLWKHRYNTLLSIGVCFEWFYLLSKGFMVSNSILPSFSWSLSIFYATLVSIFHKLQFF